MSIPEPQGPEPALDLPTFADVRAAAGRLEGIAHRTPVLTSRTLDAELGARVFLKAENLQRIGAFKFRGAYNALAKLPAGDPVVAFSSGNHAQAVALAAQLQGRHATIVMPTDSPRAKAAATRGYGAEIVEYDRYSGDRGQIAAEISERTGAHLIPPFDHSDIIAGQGTAALELFEDLAVQGESLDFLFVPCGGGGLLSGTLLAAAALAPDCRVIGVEPAAGDDVLQSVVRGERVEIDVPRTIADGAQTTLVGEQTFAIIGEKVAEMTTATDEELVEQLRFLAERLKIVVEPTGCLGLAAARARFASGAPEGARIGVILSGGNVDLGRLAQFLG